MTQVRQAGPTTRIAVAYTDRVTVRGADLCSEIIGHESFGAYFLRLLGADRTPQLATLVDATMVAIAEHGLVPSVQAARMTYAADPGSIQGAVAAGLLGCGPVILGASESAGNLLAGLVRSAEESGRSLDEVAGETLAAMRAARTPLPGFGHPLHKPEDPRAWRLIELSDQLGTTGRHVEAVLSVHRCIPEVYGRKLPLNVSGAIPAVLLDAGFPMGALKGIPLIARTASLVAHLLEEQENPIGFALSNAADTAVTYTGPPSAKDLSAEGGASCPAEC
jgi:citrate synthase